MPARPSALFLAPEAPYPIAGGGALRSASLLEYLARRYDVDVIVFRQPGAPDPAGLIPAAPGPPRHRARPACQPAQLRRPRAAQCRAGGAARAAAGGPLRRLRRADRRAPSAARRYDLGVIEHSWCAPYLEQMSPVCTPHRARSAQRGERAPRTLRRGRRPRQPPPPTASSSGASLELERAWLPRFSLVLATSQADAELGPRHRARRPRVAVYPNALPATPLPPAGDEEAIVFSGNMEYHPNLTAVRFFRREIWPRLRDRWPQLVWRLVGKNPAAVQRYHRRRPAHRSGRPGDRTPCANSPARGSRWYPC